VKSIDQFYGTRRLPLNVPPSKQTQKKLNPVDSNGVRRTCHGCSSVNHYLFDCPEVTHEKKVMFYNALEQHSQVHNPGEDPSPTATTSGQCSNSNIRYALDETNILLYLASQAPSSRALESSSFLGTCVDTGAEVYVAGARHYAHTPEAHVILRYTIVGRPKVSSDLEHSYFLVATRRVCGSLFNQNQRAHRLSSSLMSISLIWTAPFSLASMSQFLTGFRQTQRPWSYTQTRGLSGSIYKLAICL
jgi:hypothetical protein